MNLTVLSEILGAEWSQLTIEYIDGIPHYVGCYVINLLGLSSTTQAIRGSKHKPKLKFPLYRMHYMPTINHRCKVYMLTIEGIIQVIKKNRKCKEHRMLLMNNGIIISSYS